MSISRRREAKRRALLQMIDRIPLRSDRGSSRPLPTRKPVPQAPEIPLPARSTPPDAAEPRAQK